MLVEGDSDAGFYSSVAHSLETSSRVTGRNLMFVSTGDKRRVSVVARALSEVGVPMRVIVDFDALNDERTLRAIVEGVGAQWGDEFAKPRRIIDAHLRGSEPRLKVGVAQERLWRLFGQDPEREVSSTLTQEVKRALEPETGWRAAKEHGETAVPSGEATEQLVELVSSLRAIGIYVVRGGAVESFDRVVGGKGPKWLIAMIAQGRIDSNMGARDFVEAVFESF